MDEAVGRVGQRRPELEGGVGLERVGVVVEIDHPQPSRVQHEGVVAGLLEGPGGARGHGGQMGREELGVRGLHRRDSVGGF